MSQRVCFYLCLLLGSLSFTPYPVHAVMLNEIRIDQPGSDRDEYFELSGIANESLQDLSLIVIGDGTANQGVIESVVDLDGLQLNAQGFFLAAENSFSLTGNVDLYHALNFENGDNVTHMLVSHFGGQAGDDIDTNDDGGIDSVLWHSVIDSVAIINDITGGDATYSANRLLAGSSDIMHMYRDAVTGEWQTGDNTAGVEDTPGRINPGIAKVISVPEPHSLAMLLLGLGIFLLHRVSAAPRGVVRMFEPG